MDRVITQTFKIDGSLVDVVTAKLSAPGGAYGIKRNDTDVAVVPDGTIMDKSDTGTYTYTFTDAIAGVAYTAYIEFVYDDDTFYVEYDMPAIYDDYGMLCSYSSLLDRVGHFLFGIRTGFSADQLLDIGDCITDGLRDVYTAHDWSFFRPLKDVTTTAPYDTGTVEIVDGTVTLSGVDAEWPTWAADGLLKVSTNYYSVASRTSDSIIVLDDTTVDVDAGTSYELGRPEVSLPDAFEDVDGDRVLTYYPDQNELYPPVRNRHDQVIRTWQQDDPYYDRPAYFSIRTVEFDATIGSRKRLAFYPTPDAAYVLRVPMVLRPVGIDATNQYPVGGEQLSQLILESCLAAAERLHDDREAIHTKHFRELLPLAIEMDQERISPTTLGPDAPRDEARTTSEYWIRSSRIGAVALDGFDL